MSPLPPGVRITGVREGTRITAAGALVPTMITEYMVDDHGPFTITIDKAVFTTEKAHALISEEAKKILDLVK